MSAERMPVPDWSRPGETWRVAPEPNLVIATDPGIPCAQRDGQRGRTVACNRPAVAVGRRAAIALCEVHLREMDLWIEGEQVVSWWLSR